MSEPLSKRVKWRSDEAAVRRNRVAALVAVLLIAGATAFTFLKGSLGGGGFELRGEFQSASQIKGGSEVRIAGERVGEVTAIEEGTGGAALVRLRLSEEALPVHADATLAIRPRLALEGNAYVDLDPGSPMAPELGPGETVPLARTKAPVQLDQVLNVFDRSTRDAMHGAVAEIGRGLSGPGHRGLRRAIRALDRGLPPIGRVARAFRGVRPGDLGRTVRSLAALAEQLAADPRALAELVTNFNRTASALAADDAALSASVRGFAGLIDDAPPTLAALNRALPKLAEFGGDLRPALDRMPGTLASANRFLEQIEGSAQPGELRGLLTDLAPALESLPTFERRLGDLFRWSRLTTDCIVSNVVPSLNLKIPEDHIHATGDPVWLDLMHAFTGMTSFVSSVDGNGGTVRMGITSGDQGLNGILPGLGQVAALDFGAVGVRPTWLGYGVNPPFRPDQPCAEQELPDLSKRSGPPPAWPLKPTEEEPE